jgi:hypothetical protein
MMLVYASTNLLMAFTVTHWTNIVPPSTDASLDPRSRFGALPKDVQDMLVLVHHVSPVVSLSTMTVVDISMRIGRLVRLASQLDI